MAQNFNVGCASAVALLQAQVKGVHGLDLQSGALNGIPFAIEVETQLQKYRASVEDINKHSAAGAREGVYVDPDELIRRNTHNLMAAVSSLPELQ
eukprot:scaffold185274_cov23-Tisochrysis_lutea.AAC.1